MTAKKDLQVGDKVKIKRDKTTSDRLHGSEIEIKRIDKNGVVTGYDPNDSNKEVDISNYEYEED
ncbi:hypothetical protein [Kangiella sp.]|uniref:hypothetical protein n=1 Tax=Kangiella sp. TaxID=1920245 RepID=UPI003A92AD31